MHWSLEWKICYHHIWQQKHTFTFYGSTELRVTWEHVSYGYVHVYYILYLPTVGMPTYLYMGMPTNEMHRQTDVYYTHILHGHSHGRHAQVYYTSACPRIIYFITHEWGFIFITNTLWMKNIWGTRIQGFKHCVSIDTVRVNQLYCIFRGVTHASFPTTGST